MPTSRAERAAEIARESIDLRIKNTIALIEESGGVGFTANAGPQESLQYYKDQIIPNGVLDPAGFAATADRIGADGMLELVAAMERDHARQQQEAPKQSAPDQPPSSGGDALTEALKA